MKKILIYTIWYLISTLLYAQKQTKIDSLLTILKRDKEDTNKAIHLNRLSWELSNQKPDTAIILANQALLLSQEIKSNKHIANSLYQIAWANYVRGNYAASIENNLKALSLREELNDKSGMARSLGNIGIVYANQGNLSKALDYYFKALKINEVLNDKDGISINVGNIGSAYLNQGDYSNAIVYYFRALNRE